MSGFRPGGPSALAGLLISACIVRSIAWARTTVLFDDGPLFLYMAEAMRAGEWSAVLRHPYHPLYSLLTWGVSPLVGGDLEQAGALVSILAGTAAVAALFVFLRDAFGPSAAFLGGLMLALHPFAVEFSSDVQSDGLYLALLLFAICLLWRAIEREDRVLACAAGAASALAYLVRPEGLGVTAIGALAGGLLALRRSWRLPQAALWLAALGLGTALVAGPYVVALRQETGVWSLTQKKSLGALLSLSAGRSGAEEALAQPGPEAASLPLQKSLTLASRLTNWRELPITDRLVPAYSELWKAAVSGIRVEGIVLVLLGIFSVRGRPGRRGWFVFSFVALYGALLYALAMNSGYVSRRHALPPLVLLLGYAGLGSVVFCGALVDAWSRLSSRRPHAGREAAALATATVLIAAMWLPRDLRSRRDERLAERLAAEWLRAEDPEVQSIGAGRLRVAYYAGAEFVPIPPLGTPGASAPLLGYLQALGARYVIIDEAVAAEHGGLVQAREGGMQLMHREHARGYSAAVFSVPAAPE
jgi:4-amino-4-deoxy-L-arabinose transferase-like glycosyltransferase